MDQVLHYALQFTQRNANVKRWSQNLRECLECKSVHTPDIQLQVCTMVASASLKPLDAPKHLFDGMETKTDEYMDLHFDGKMAPGLYPYIPKECNPPVSVYLKNITSETANPYDLRERLYHAKEKLKEMKLSHAETIYSIFKANVYLEFATPEDAEKIVQWQPDIFATSKPTVVCSKSPRVIGYCTV